MKTIKEAYEAMDCNEKTLAWNREKARVRKQRDRAACHAHYFFPGLPTRLQYTHDMAGGLRRMNTHDLSALIRRHPAVADWYNVNKEKTTKRYIAAFCAANHLKP